MRLLRQCLKGFPQHDEGQMGSQLFGSDSSVECRLLPEIWNIELSGLQS